MPPERAPRDDITDEQRAEAVTNVLSGKESEREAARRLGVHHNAVSHWRKDYLGQLPGLQAVSDPDAPPPTAADFEQFPELGTGANDDRDRSPERLSRYVYDACIAQLEAIAARARVTSRVGFVEKQTADHLAHLDQVGFDNVVRLLQSLAWLREADGPDGRGLPAPRNGSLGPAA